MFQILTNNSLPNTNLEFSKRGSVELEPLKINVPCFYLTNGTTLNSFVPMFNIESTDEDILNIEEFTFTVSSIPSLYTMVEMDIDTLEPLEDITTLYLNGSKYQNLLDIEELVLFREPEVIEEREST